MKNVSGLIRRFVGILFISLLLIFILNIALLYVMGSRRTASGSPYTLADEVGRALTKNGDGYSLSAELEQTLQSEGAWAIAIDNGTHNLVWSTGPVPRGVPQEYSLSDISDLTLGYLESCPTYVGDTESGVVVLGYPPDRYWKSMWPTWDYSFIANLPQTALMVLVCNVLLIFSIYLWVTGKLIRSVNPVIEGIRGLPENRPVSVKEKGVLSELASSINHTSELLQAQQYQLRKKDTARANWIAGVSHDIRTPLSMVMGCAGQLADDPSLSEQQRKKAEVIVKQSRRMKNLINDLNLASRLEYNMQPLTQKMENAVSIVRQVAVDHINTDIDGKYPVEWTTDEALTSCFVNADRDLLKRAVSNLIQNSVNHNEGGCTIYVSVLQSGENCVICIEDSGAGVSGEQLELLRSTPHYMVCDTNTAEQRHGLGLLIVKQIAQSHGGSTEIDHSIHGGLAVKIILPTVVE